MHNRDKKRTASHHTDYRERLSPTLWVLASATVCAPMAVLVLMPFDAVVALIVGVMVAVGLIGLMIAASPTVLVRNGVLSAGRAHIDVQWLGDIKIFMGDQARHQRGPGLNPRAWHLIRGGIDGVVVVAVTDPNDPVTEWVISSRTPERLAAILRNAKRHNQYTPDRRESPPPTVNGA